MPKLEFQDLANWEMRTAKGQGLLKGRSAWNHGKETWLVDLPLVVLAINRLRTPQARRFRAASLEQSLKIMGGNDEVARGLANAKAHRSCMSKPRSAQRAPTYTFPAAAPLLDKLLTTNLALATDRRCRRRQHLRLSSTRESSAVFGIATESR